MQGVAKRREKNRLLIGTKIQQAQDVVCFVPPV
jgi:hypothetical protein